jgi:ribonuclease D
MNITADQKSVIIYQGDIGERALEYFSAQGALGCDTETNGLSPERNDLQLIQIASKDNKIALVQFKKGTVPERVNALMENSNITKIFHHAPFDLGFLGTHAKSRFDNIFCTKIASMKVRGAKGPKGFHSLKTVSKEILGVDLDKTFMDGNNLPDWTGVLTDRHVEYATHDVLVLIPLYEYFLTKLTTTEVGLVKTGAVKNNATYY